MFFYGIVFNNEIFSAITSTAKAKIKIVAIQSAIGLAVRTVAIRELIEVMRDLQLSRLNEPTPTEERLGGCNKTQLPLQFIA